MKYLYLAIVAGILLVVWGYSEYKHQGNRVFFDEISIAQTGQDLTACVNVSHIDSAQIIRFARENYPPPGKHEVYFFADSAAPVSLGNDPRATAYHSGADIVVIISGEEITYRVN